MIRNIVFDMGNVLLRYDPRPFLPRFGLGPADADAVMDALFNAPEWRQLDAGAITDADMERAALARLPERLHAQTVSAFAAWPDLYEPLPEAEALVRALKANGYSLYLLSNASMRWFSYETRFPVFALLDGRIISAAYKAVKPEPAIYRALFDTYGLQPAECFFIDDLPANIAGGERLGMRGFALTQFQYPELREALAAAGVRV